MKAPEAEAAPPWRWRTDGLLAAGLMALYAAAAWPLLARSLWHDEIVTLRLFSQAFRRLSPFYSYAFPNNHQLHTVLVRLSVDIFGPTEWAIRLPALFGGCLLLAVAYAWLRQHRGRAEALLYTAVLGATGTVFGYTLHARGYSLMMAFSALALMAFCRYAGGDHRWRWLALAWSAAVLAVLTIPVALLLCGALGCTQLAMWVADWRQRRWEPRRFFAEMAFSLGALQLILLFYLPILQPLAEASRAGPPGSPSLALAWLAYVTRLPGWLAILAMVAGIIWLPGDGWRTRLALGLTLALPLLLVGFGLLGGPERAMLFAVPAAWYLVVGLLHRLVNLAERRAPHWAALAVVGLVAGIALRADVVAVVREPNGAIVQADGADWKEAVATARAAAQPGDLIVARLTEPPRVIYPSLTWYLYEGPDGDWQAEQNAAAVTRLRKGLSGRLTIHEIAFRDLWKPSSGDSLDPWAGAVGLVAGTEVIGDFRTARLRTVHLDLPAPVSVEWISGEQARLQDPTKGGTIGVRGEIYLQASANERASLGFPIRPSATARRISFGVEVEVDTYSSMVLAPEGFVRWGDRATMAAALVTKGGWQPSSVNAGIDALDGSGYRAFASIAIPMRTNPDERYRRFLLWGIADVPAGRSVVWLTAHFRKKGESLRCRGVTVTDYGPPQPGK